MHLRSIGSGASASANRVVGGTVSPDIFGIGGLIEIVWGYCRCIIAQLWDLDGLFYTFDVHGFLFQQCSSPKSYSSEKEGAVERK